MKTATLCAGVFLLVVTSWAFAVSVDRDITADYVKSHPKEFTVNVTEEASGLLAFTVVFATPEPRYVVAHLVVRDSETTYATSDTPSFTKNRSNTFHFSVPRNLVATSTFSLGVSGFADSGGEAVPRPGTIENKFQLLDFVPQKAAATTLNSAQSGASNQQSSPPETTDGCNACPLTDAEAIAERFSVALKRQALFFLDQPRIEALQSELRDDVAKSSQTPLSDVGRAALMVGIDGFVTEHFRAEERDRVYLRFRDQFETLKWQLRIAVSHAPLTGTELARREQQRKWMEGAIKALPESPKFRITHQDQLAKLGLLLSDPLNPFLAYSMSEPDFARFQKAFEEDIARVGAYKSLSYAVSWLTQAAIETQIESLLREWPVKNRGYHRTNTRWSLIVTPSVGNRSLQLEDVNTNLQDVYADVLQNIFVREDAPADLAEREAWLLKQPNGDLCFDTKLDSLVGVRGAKLAVLDAPNWYTADRVSLASLHRLIDAHGQASLPMSHFCEPLSPDEPVRRPRKPQPSLVVRTGGGDISVIRLVDVDPVVIMPRRRPLSPNPPLHPGDQPEEPGSNNERE